jgi:PAS domain S-box-containing protein
VQLAFVQTLVTVALALGIAAYVATRRERQALHWLICAQLLTVSVWAASMGLRHVPWGDSYSRASLAGWFVGVALMPPLWLAVASRLTQTRLIVSGRTLSFALGLAVLLGLVAFASNPLHGLMIRDGSFDALERGASHYAGPLFWGQLAWCYAITLAGCLLYLRQARRMVGRGEAGRGLAVMVAAILPLGGSILRALGWIPTSYSLTPAAVSVSIVLLMSVYWRHHLSGLVPVARQDVIDSLPDAVVVTDPQGRTIDANPAAEKLFAAAKERLCGRSIVGTLTSLGVDLDPEELQRSHVAANEGEGPAFTRLRLRDGRRFEVTSQAVQGPDEALAGYYAVFRDCTEQRNLERFLHQSQRLEMVAGLAAGVAHEVNNPLAYVRANLNHVKVLAEESREAPGPKPEEADELRLVVDECIDGVDRISRIIDGMLRFSHLEAGGLTSVDVNQVVTDAVRLAQLYETGTIDIDAVTDAALPPVWGSSENLVQAVLNLLVNGKHALADRDGAHIRIRTRTEHREVVIEVSDNGPGVPEDLRGRIFDPFVTTKGPGEGSGLGLAISAEIARKHGGRLALDPAAGEGATFRLRLPVGEVRA